MLNSLKTMLGFCLLALIGVSMGCSNDTSPVASYSASKSHTAGDDGTTVTTVTGTIIESPVVAVPDTNLANAIKAQIGLDDAATALTENDLASLDTLNAGGLGIVNLTGLEHATGLKYLKLNHNSITNLGPLAGLDSLTYLNLYANYTITDLDPLKALTGLETLAIGGNPLNGNVAPLKGLTKLKGLRANAIGLKNDGLKTLAHNLTALEGLNISGNRGLSDFSPLTCLTKLKGLTLRSMFGLDTPIYEISADVEGDGIVILDPALLFLATREDSRVTIDFG